MDEGTSAVCGCASPGRGAFSGDPTPGSPQVFADRGRHDIEQVTVPSGTFIMGDSSGDANRGDGETPLHSVTLPAFDIDATTVTNADFATFVDDTDYTTDAERWGFSAVFHLAVTAPPADHISRPPRTPWWVGVKGASWRSGLAPGPWTRGGITPLIAA